MLESFRLLSLPYKEISGASQSIATGTATNLVTKQNDDSAFL